MKNAESTMAAFLNCCLVENKEAVDASCLILKDQGVKKLES